jgi:SnoaL-like domain
MSTSTHRELQRLIDLEEIRQLKARFGRLADALCVGYEETAARELGALFSEEATIDSAAFGHYEGRAQIETLFARAVPSQMHGMWHGFLNPEIALDGDQAHAHWAMFAYTHSADPAAGGPALTLGRYRDEYRRVNGRWLQSKLYFETWPVQPQHLADAAAGTRNAMRSEGGR